MAKEIIFMREEFTKTQIEYYHTIRVNSVFWFRTKNVLDQIKSSLFHNICLHFTAIRRLRLEKWCERAGSLFLVDIMCGTF